MTKVWVPIELPDGWNVSDVEIEADGCFRAVKPLGHPLKSDKGIDPLLDGITPPGEVDPLIVYALEQLLAKARAGEVRGVAFVALDRPDRGMWWFHVNPPLHDTLLGLLSRLTHQAVCAVDATQKPG